jgi:acetyltransferase-like isoleucine patch superfamily enzyme
MTKPPTNFHEFSVDALPACIPHSGQFADNCRVRISHPSLISAERGTLRVQLSQIGPARIDGLDLEIGTLSGQVLLSLGGSNSTLRFGEGTQGHFNCIVWRDSILTIGESTTSNGVRIYLDHCDVTLGRDCMLSDTITIQGADQHGIIDVQTQKLINSHRRTISIGEHVWLGRGSTIMPDTIIGAGSIVGAASVVTKDIPPLCVAAGAPARVVRQSTTWSRNPEAIDDSAAALIAQYDPSHR